jgi:hypothetical protein
MQVIRQVRVPLVVAYVPIADIKLSILVDLLVIIENVQNVELR